MKIQKWTEEYQVYWHDVDLKGKMSFAALSRYLQDVAWRGAESVDFGFKKVSELNLHWVLVRQLVKMKKMPNWGDNIKIETWPRGVDGLWAFRDYQVKSNTDDILGGVSSAWMLIDADTRRPQKLEVLKGVLPEKILASVIEESAGKILFNDSEKLIDTRQVRYSEMDMNGHVNNSKYVDWIMDALNKDSRQDEYLNFHINYLSEVKNTDEIKIAKSDKKKTIQFKATNQKNKPIFIAELF